MDRIERVFDHRGQGLILMSHGVAGYPDLRESRRLLLTMSAHGADLLEVQIPFSDPLADGPTIMTASQAALDAGVTPKDCFGLIGDICRVIRTPVVVMTYLNIPHHLGMESFVRQSADAGAAGIILPDLPVDAPESAGYYRLMKQARLCPVPVISPGMASSRLDQVLKAAKGFVYLTLKVGITGARRDNDPAGIGFLRRVRKRTPLPLLAGFGISSISQVRQVQKEVDGVVVGSHLIDLYRSRGREGIGEFLSRLKKAATG